MSNNDEIINKVLQDMLEFHQMFNTVGMRDLERMGEFYQRNDKFHLFVNFIVKNIIQEQQITENVNS